MKSFWFSTDKKSSAESQKGINAIQRCSIENQKGTITVDFVQRENQQNIFTVNAILALKLTIYFHLEITASHTAKNNELKNLRNKASDNASQVSHSLQGS